MNIKNRPLVTTAFLAAMSVGLVPQVLASPNAHTATANEVAATTVVVPTDGQKAAGYLKQWMFDPNNPHHPLYAKSSFSGPASKNTNLKNSFERKFLQWEDQVFGMNLGWTDDASPSTAVAVSRWFFTRSDTTHPLKYGDTIALGYGVKPSYIRYSSQLFGINLDWSSTPKYEWKLLGGKIGTVVRSGDWLSIYNTVTKQPLISFDRNVGADIGWPNSERWEDQIDDVIMKFIKDHWKEGVAYLLTLI